MFRSKEGQTCDERAGIRLGARLLVPPVTRARQGGGSFGHSLTFSSLPGQSQNLVTLFIKPASVMACFKDADVASAYLSRSGMRLLVISGILAEGKMRGAFLPKTTAVASPSMVVVVHKHLADASLEDVDVAVCHGERHLTIGEARVAATKRVLDAKGAGNTEEEGEALRRLAWFETYLTRRPCRACGAPPTYSLLPWFRCGACTSVSYCTERCKDAHWPHHRRFCALVKPPAAMPDMLL